MTDLKERVSYLCKNMKLKHSGRLALLMIVMRDEGLIDGNNALGFINMLKNWNLNPCGSSAISKKMMQLPDNGISNYKSWANISWAQESYKSCLSIKKLLFNGDI